MTSFASFGFITDYESFDLSRFQHSLSTLDEHLDTNYSMTILCRSKSDTLKLKSILSGSCSRHVNLVYSNRDIKEWSLPTLFMQHAFGDVLFFTRSQASFTNLVQLLALTSGFEPEHHVSWVSSGVEQNAYSILNREYGKEVVSSTAIGFVATRQAVNSAMANDADLYDAFITLGLYNNDVGDEIKLERLFDSANLSSAYTQFSDISRILTRYVSPYRPSVIRYLGLNWSLTIAAILALYVLVTPLFFISSNLLFGLAWGFLAVIAVIVTIGALIFTSVSDNVSINLQLQSTVTGKKVAGLAEEISVM